MQKAAEKTIWHGIFILTFKIIPKPTRSLIFGFWIFHQPKHCKKNFKFIFLSSSRSQFTWIFFWHLSRWNLSKDDLEFFSQKKCWIVRVNFARKKTWEMFSNFRGKIVNKKNPSFQVFLHVFPHIGTNHFYFFIQKCNHHICFCVWQLLFWIMHHLPQ